MGSELATAFTDQINQVHARGQSLDQELARVILEKLNTTRACGQLCASAQSDLTHGQFAELLKTLDFDQGALRSYLDFARKHPEPFNDLKAAIRAIEAALTPTGAIALPEGHGPQKLHVSSFFSVAARVLLSFLASWRKYIATRPLTAWESMQLESFAVELKPVADIFAQVQREIEARRQ